MVTLFLQLVAFLAFLGIATSVIMYLGYRAKKKKTQDLKDGIEKLRQKWDNRPDSVNIQSVTSSGHRYSCYNNPIIDEIHAEEMVELTKSYPVPLEMEEVEAIGPEIDDSKFYSTPSSIEEVPVVVETIDNPIQTLSNDPEIEEFGAGIELGTSTESSNSSVCNCDSCDDSSSSDCNCDYSCNCDSVDSSSCDSGCSCD